MATEQPSLVLLVRACRDRRCATRTLRSTSAGSEAPVESADEQQLRDCANALRASQGLPALIENTVLDRAARFTAVETSRQHLTSDIDAQGRNPLDRIQLFGDLTSPTIRVAENSAVGAASGSAACQAVSNDSGDRAHLLDPGYAYVGVGSSNGDWVEELTSHNLLPK